MISDRKETGDMTKIKVPYIDQSGRYPTGCESVTAVMLLRYLGCDITVDGFIRNCLRCRAMEQREDGLYGPDPNDFSVEVLMMMRLLDAMHRHLREHLSGRQEILLHLSMRQELP